MAWYGMAYGLYLVLKAFNLILSSLFFIMLGLPVLSNYHTGCNEWSRVPP